MAEQAAVVVTVAEQAVGEVVGAVAGTEQTAVVVAVVAAAE